MLISRPIHNRREVAVPSKRSILETLTRATLLDVGASLEVSGLTGKPKEEVID